MTVELTEQRLGQLRWLVVEGPARDAFTALAGWPDLERLRAQVAEPPMNLPRRPRRPRRRPGRDRPQRHQLAAAAVADRAQRRRVQLLEGRCLLLTLLLDGEQPVTAYCKPGFLPSTAFTVTGSGLTWAIDHMQAAGPGEGAGRHFVARGYAYTIGDQSGRIVTVESSAGQFASREAGVPGPLAGRAHGHLPSHQAGAI